MADQQMRRETLRVDLPGAEYSQQFPESQIDSQRFPLELQPNHDAGVFGYYVESVQVYPSNARLLVAVTEQPTYDGKQIGIFANDNGTIPIGFHVDSAKPIVLNLINFTIGKPVTCTINFLWSK